MSENATGSSTQLDILTSFHFSAILEVAGEICGSDENEVSSMSSLQGHSGDLWDNIFTLTQRRRGKKSHLPALDGPNDWPHAVQHAALAALLDGAVGHAILEQRKEYIQRIMALPPDVQRALMSLIERRKASKTPKKALKTPSTNPVRPKDSRTSLGDANPLTSPTRPVLSISSNQNDTPSTLASPSSEKRTSPRRRYEEAFPPTPQTNPSKRQSPRGVGINKAFQSPGLGDTAAVEREFQTLREQTVQLRRELTERENREIQLQEQLEQSQADLRQKLIKVEAEASRRHDETHSKYQRQLADMKAQLARMQDQHEKASQAQSQLALVQDEHDLLRHTQQQLVETQERLSTYREKVQHLADVKDALKREEEAHSKSVQECLRLRNDLQTLHPLQRQLDEYKTRAIEAEVRLTETQHSLQKLQQDGLLNGSASTDLERTCQAQLEEIQELRLRLQQESNLKGIDSSSGVGDGLSELNPELKEEVFRLRDENQRLRDFFDSRQDDAVSKLKGELDDVNRLADRYKSQYLTTREQLEHKHRQLTTSKNREAKFRVDVQDCMAKLKDSQETVEEVSQELHRAQQDLMASRNKEAELEAELAKWIESAEELREKSNASSGELRTCLNTLEVCQAKENKLNQDVIQLTADLRMERESHKETQKELLSTQEIVQTTERQASDLRDQLDQWIAKAQQLEDRITTLNGNMDMGKAMLVQARGKEERLTVQVTQASQFLSEANKKCEELVNELSQVREQLSETKADLSASQESETHLKSSLLDTTKRAEDLEALSQHQKEQIDSLQRMLQSSRVQIESLQAKERELLQEKAAVTKRAGLSEQKALALQSTLSEAVRNLNATKLSNDENLEKLSILSEKLSVKSKMVEDWKKQAIAATDEVHSLQESISQIQNSLANLHGDLHISQSNEESRGQDVQHAGHIIMLLEDTVEHEIDERRKVEEQLEMTQAKIEKMRDDYEAIQAQLVAQVDERSEQVEQFKQEVFRFQEALNEAQSSLNGSEHREKMLQLEITKLHHLATALEEALTTTKEAMQRQATESAQSFDSTCQMLQTKAQQDIQEVETRMNQLLEQERRAKRELDEQVKVLKDSHKQKLSELQTSFHESREATSNVKEIEMQKLRQNYEEQLAHLKTVADDAHTNLVAKGKRMLKEVKVKAKEEHESLRKEFHELERRLVKERDENEKVIIQAKTKVAGYKKKLEFASSRITNLTNEVDELESRLKSLEREKFKLSEENDRYRRQIGGRGGPDSKLQGQFEQLQKEFKSAMEEARELRRKLKEQQETPGMGFLESNGAPTDPSYSRNAMNQSTLVQLRSEYEETIEALNDEKRELVMKNSAAATDVQKAEKRAWESEKESAHLKQINTSLQLQVERLHQLMSSMDDDAVPPPPPARAPYSPRVSRAFESYSSTEDDAIELKETLTDSTTPIADEGSVSSPLPPINSSLPYSSPFKGALARASPIRTNGLPSFVHFHSPTNGQPEGPPECQQS